MCLSDTFAADVSETGGLFLSGWARIFVTALSAPYFNELDSLTRRYPNWDRVYDERRLVR